MIALLRFLPLLLPIALMIYIITIYIPEYRRRGWRGYDLMLVVAFGAVVLMFLWMLHLERLLRGVL